MNLEELLNVLAEEREFDLRGYKPSTLERRLRKRMGHKKAIVALAHRILVIIYHLLKEQQPYRELGPDHVEEKAHEASKNWAVRRLEQLGYQVTLQMDEVA